MRPQHIDLCSFANLLPRLQILDRRDHGHVLVTMARHSDLGPVVIVQDALGDDLVVLSEVPVLHLLDDAERPAAMHVPTMAQEAGGDGAAAPAPANVTYALLDRLASAKGQP